MKNNDTRENVAAPVGRTNKNPGIEFLALPFLIGVGTACLLYSYYAGLFRDPSFIRLFCSTSNMAVITLLLMYGFRRRKQLRLMTICLIFFIIGGSFYFSSHLLIFKCPGIGDIDNACINSLFGIISRTCDFLFEQMQKNIENLNFKSADTTSLLKALTIGDKTKLDKETIQLFRDAGASHILALSGLHLGFIYLLLSKILKFLGNGPVIKVIKSIVLIAVTGLYTITCGASASLVRAFLFISIKEFLKIMQRSTNDFKILCLSLCIQLIYNPKIISSIGFQLSYLAICGIIILLPRMEKWYPDSNAEDTRKSDKPKLIKFNPLKTLWQWACVAISCQLFTFPAVWFHFHTFFRYFLISNIICVPLTSLLMTISLSNIILSQMGIFIPLLITINEMLANLLIKCLQIISQM